MDLSSFNLSANDFIDGGKVFDFRINWKKGNTEISVLSYVEKGNDDIYELTVKGNYERGSSAKVTLTHPSLNLSKEKMLEVAKTSMLEIIPFMVANDYPESLINVAKDKKARENGWQLLKLGNDDYDPKVWEKFEETKYCNDPYWVHNNGEIWRHTVMGFGPPNIKLNQLQ